MTKRDFKARRSLFKEGRFKHHRNFNQFREVFREKRRREWRVKIAIALAILAFLISMIFTVSAEPQVQSPKDFTEIKFNYANQKL